MATVVSVIQIDDSIATHLPKCPRPGFKRCGTRHWSCMGCPYIFVENPSVHRP